MDLNTAFTSSEQLKPLFHQDPYYFNLKPLLSVGVNSNKSKTYRLNLCSCSFNMVMVIFKFWILLSCSVQFVTFQISDGRFHSNL